MRDEDEDEEEGATRTLAPPSVWGRLRSVASIGAVAFALGALTLVAVWALRERRETQRAYEKSVTVGYVDIFPQVSYAQRPKAWRRDEPGRTLLWSSWDGNGHHWYEFPPGHLSGYVFEHYQNGRDVVRAIDEPLLEIGGGERWRRMPKSHPVVVLKSDQGERACPLKVLEKVEVINDVRNGTPVLITFAPFALPEKQLAAFDPVLDGERLTMGTTGYFLNKRHVLYDREGEGLWARGPEGLLGLAGQHKGRCLPLIEFPRVTTFGEWSEARPEGELVVGADRSGTKGG